jgi:hypothetical protein
MRCKPFVSIAAVALAAIMGAGCAGSDDDPEDAPEDSTAPVAGAQISFSAVLPVGATASWGAGSDDVTAASGLRYKLVRAWSAEDIDTVAEADAVGGEDLMMDWSTDALSAPIVDAPGMTTCCFAALVRDEAGNMALYGPIILVISEYFSLSIDTGFLISAPNGSATAYVVDYPTGEETQHSSKPLNAIGECSFSFDSLFDSLFIEPRIVILLFNHDGVLVGSYQCPLTGLVGGTVECKVRDGGIFTLAFK